MSKSKQTPAPWVATNDKSGYFIHGGAFGGAWVTTLDHDTSLLDRKIIVAAPDLLAALEAAPKLSDYYDDREELTLDYASWFDGPRAAALAKAKVKP